MPQLRDFLARFRPAGSPGAAARVAVPATPSGEPGAELGPVLRLLADADARRADIIARARRQAEEITAGANAQAAGIAADAEGRARAARDAAARDVMAAAQDEAARAIDDARQQAARVGELAVQRMPTLVSRTVELIRQLGADGP